MSAFNKNFFINNRKNLNKELSGHVLFLTAHSKFQKSADEEYEFRQESSFWYFTGLSSADYLAAIDCDTGDLTIFRPILNNYQNEWDGDYTDEEIKKICDAKEIIDSKDFKRFVNDNMKKVAYLPPAPKVMKPYGFYTNPARKNLQDKLTRAGLNKNDLVDARKAIAHLRAVKQDVEIECIKKAIKATQLGLAEAGKIINSANNEKDLERAMAGEFYRNADGHAFTPIVASGAGATVIHRRDNDAELQENQLILFDVGAKFHGYAADISRTYVRGETTKRQKEIYDAVEDIQKYAISLLKPGISIKDWHDKVNEKYRDYTSKLGVNYYPEGLPHLLGHFLGIDLHDAGDYMAPLEPGCVLTVEPGLYLPEEGIGVRIEDDVLITENGVEILSESIPKML